MRKIILLPLCIFLAATCVNAQSVHFGVKGGLNLHKIKGAPFKEKFNFGYQVGVFAEINIIPGIGIQPELLLSNVTSDTVKGFTASGFQPMNKISFTYLEVPLLLNFKAIPFLSFQLGPQFDIKLDDANAALASGKEAFKKSNVGIAGGLQVSVKKLKLYGRYVLGLSNLNENGAGDRWKDQSIKLGIGYRLF